MRFTRTYEAGWLHRYSLNDGFGKPSVAFVICTFWLIEALAATGRREEARAVFERIHAALSPLGFFPRTMTRDAAHVGQFPPDLLPCWSDPCGFRRLAIMDGCAVRGARTSGDLERSFTPYGFDGIAPVDNQIPV